MSLAAGTRNSRPLAALASDPAASRGRLHPEQPREVRGPRGPFQRDRDRIVHSIAFRRLRHKTQVFIAPDGDHYRVRLTHSLEVAQIGRTIARALGLDEDLTEAMCLAHDIGHPPFGHAGEKALDRALTDYGGFDHNAQTLRTLMLLECPYPGFDGLNLSWETLEGLAKHNGPVAAPGWAMQAADAAFPLALLDHASLEAQVAALADDIAYDNHDIDDGLRAGMLTPEALAEQPFVKATLARVRGRYPDAPADRLWREVVRDQIGQMVNDLIAGTIEACAKAGVRTVADVRAAGVPLVCFSDEMAAAERGLKRWMYANLYHHPAQAAAADGAGRVTGAVVAALLADPRALGPDRADRLPEDPVWRARHVGDYVAGMTDRFALSLHERLVGPVPDALSHV